MIKALFFVFDSKNAKLFFPTFYFVFEGRIFRKLENLYKTHEYSIFEDFIYQQFLKG